MKFTPTDLPKNPTLHDATKKVHVKFDADPDVEKDQSKKRALDTTTAKVDRPAKKSKSDRQPISAAPAVVKANKRQRDATDNSKDLKPASKKNSKADTGAKAKHLMKKYKGTKPVAKPLAADIEARVRKIREKKSRKRLAKKMVDGVQASHPLFLRRVNVPVLRLNLKQLKAKMPIRSIRQYLLYCLMESKTPTWAEIVNKGSLQRLVLLFVQGLDITYFGVPETRQSPNHFVDLKSLGQDCVGKASMPFLSSNFSDMVINKISGTKGKIDSPIAEVLQCELSLSQKEKIEKDHSERLEKYKQNMREFYTLTLDEMKTAGYPIPPFLDNTAVLPEGWKETSPSKNPAPSKKLIALDCEMVMTTSGSSLARVTLVDEGKRIGYGTILLDEFVKPSEPIVDYLTRYSGITPEIMEQSTCSLKRAQKHVRKLVNHDVILVGHGLENDLRALKLVHPFCADTSILYDHFKGPPYKPSLRVLARNLLRRKIQEHNETKLGHDSAEDARATLDLFKKKLQMGPSYGRFSNLTELIFDRLQQFNPPKSGAIVESTTVANRLFGATLGSDYVQCDTDSAMVEKVVEEISTKDFVMCRCRTLERENSDEAAVPSVVPEQHADQGSVATKLARLDEHIRKLYEGLPPATAIVIMGGVGDVPKYQELWKKKMELTYGDAKEGEKDNTSTKRWTDTDQRRLETESAKARMGSTFFVLKQ
ncbi:hypothetical protein DFQ28_002436 [Apophysomyces sp. BC1034]|nr:hypothetical protein DFQ30_000485 [Apophysomyces sp. BC1015]KAG0177842.1 hypothetical protein DFQ29_004267 [Apophysomyces sp. BC1021]KAG0190156.1 hypothetical protein DFQ28_002436 [Apophysomyces sp. BC1034]